MQNRYVGDVGDFAKHGLLRRLSEVTDAPDLRLGLVWYLFPDERHDGDSNKISRAGELVGYLDPERADAATYRDCDPDLWEVLGTFVREGRRCVHCVQKSAILPAGTLYYDAALSFIPGLPQATRETVRDHWFAGALRATASADLVCVDPDNGIAQPDMMYRQRGPKYTYISDLQEFWDRGQSLVVYQHRDRTKASVQIAGITTTLRNGLPGAEPIPLQFSTRSARVFFVLPQPAHRERIEERIVRMLDGPWQQHFERAGGGDE